MKPKVIIGVDPGKSGAWAICIEGDVVALGDFPFVPGVGVISQPELAMNLNITIGYYALGSSYHIGAMLEHPTPIAGNGVNNVFAQGEGWGLMVGAIQSVVTDLTLIRTAYPNQWKPAVGVTSDKKTSLTLARMKFPRIADQLTRAKDDGRAEAALIARYGHDTWEIT